VGVGGLAAIDTQAKESLLKGWLSTDDLHVTTSSDHLLLILLIFFLLYKTSYLYKEDNRTEPSPSVRAPCPGKHCKR